jgi:hypothetical protein
MRARRKSGGAVVQASGMVLDVRMIWSVAGQLSLASLARCEASMRRRPISIGWVFAVLLALTLSNETDGLYTSVADRDQFSGLDSWRDSPCPFLTNEIISPSEVFSSPNPALRSGLYRSIDLLQRHGSLLPRRPTLSARGKSGCLACLKT